MQQELPYYILTLGFIVLVIFISYAAFEMGQALKSLKRLIDEVEDTTRDVNLMKDKIKLGALNSIATILGLFFKKRR